MWEGLSGGCRAGLTLERCSQLSVFAIRLVGLDAAVVWLVEDSVHKVRLFRAPIRCLLRGGDTREAGSTVAGSLVYRVGTHQIRRGRGVARSSTSQGSAEPLARESKVSTGRFLEGKLISDHDIFPSGPRYFNFPYFGTTCGLEKLELVDQN